MLKVGVILSGSGVYDGTEIQEAVSCLIALDKLNAKAVCFAPDVEQHHVINHTSGDEMPETRNVMIESARICRGDIHDLSTFNADDVDAIILPGGFGAAKNLSSWAFDGPDCQINQDVKHAILDAHGKGKPIGAFCVAPVVVAKVFEESGITPKLTLGTTAQDSEYDIDGFHQGISSVGAETEECNLGQWVLDEDNKIVSTPCYMQKASVGEIYDGIYRACEKLLALAS